MHDIKHKCGVFGVFGIDEAAVLTALGLHALQHRGQEAGIVSFDGDHFHSVKRDGLVGDHFNKAETLKSFQGEQQWAMFVIPLLEILDKKHSAIIC